MTLELLVPWDLPLELSLSEQEQRRANAALDELETVLCLDCCYEAIDRVQVLLQSLPAFDKTKCVEPKQSSTLRKKEIEAYDKYFDVSHIQCEEKAFALIAGLAECCRAFFKLQRDHSKLDEALIKNQRIGFLNQIQLFRRVMMLEEAS